jgi:hypothetical protein
VALRASSMLMHLEAIPRRYRPRRAACYVGDGIPCSAADPPIPEIAADYWIVVPRLRRAACVRATIGGSRRCLPA